MPLRARRRARAGLLVLGWLGMLALPLVAETAGVVPSARRFVIARSNGSIEIDGVLGDEGWQSALRFDLPYEHSPGDNAAPPVETEVWMTYDDEALYVAWRAHDPSPGAIRAHLMDRDAAVTFVQDDHVSLLIDAFDDERRGIRLQVNPLGVQLDSRVSENDGTDDTSYDLIWSSVGRIDDQGYAVEIRVPLEQLRFPRTTEVQTWGIGVERSYPRMVRHRIASWPLDRGRSCNLCQIDKVAGFENLRPGRDIELTPTVTAQRRETRDGFPGTGLERGDDDVDLGISARWGMTPNLTVNAAINPDFSQVEADAAQLAVNERFALLFPEKRPFFLEGSDLFTTPILALFSRTVVDPDWGLKLTGKEGANGIGAFVVEDSVNQLVLPSNQRSRSILLPMPVTSSALRYRRDVGRGSTIGLLYAGRDGDDYANDVFGVDAYFRLNDANTLQVQVLRSETEYPDEVAAAFEQPGDRFSGDALIASYEYGGRYWQGRLAYRELGPDFRADSGFVPRVDTQEGRGSLQRRFWGEPGAWYTQIDVGVVAQRTEDQDGQLTDELLELYTRFAGPLQSEIRLGYQQNQTFFGGVLYDDLNRATLSSQVQPNGAVKLALAAEVGEQIDVTNNQRADVVELSPSIELKLGRHVNVQLEHVLSRFDVDAGRLFEANLTQLRLVYNFNVRTFVRAIVQYLDLERDPAQFPFAVAAAEEGLLTQLLFSYKVNPQTVLFLGYADDHRGEGDVSLLQTDRTLFFKVGYAWSL